MGEIAEKFGNLFIDKVAVSEILNGINLILAMAWLDSEAFDLKFEGCLVTKMIKLKKTLLRRVTLSDRLTTGRPLTADNSIGIHTGKAFTEENVLA